MSNLKTKLASQLNKVDKQSIVGNVTQGPCDIPQEAEAQVLPLNAPIPVDTPPMQVVPQFAITFNDAKDRIQMLQKFVREFMIPGIDYGVIPGCQKPSLLKAGAEKLTDIYGFSKLVAITNRIEDWEKPLFAYEVKVTLINKRTGLVEAEGIGSCNSKERKYRNQDAYSICNTILKMAKKRALIDSVLSASRSSGVFSQDLEDIYVEADTHKSNVAPPINVSSIKTASLQPVTQQQLKQMFELAAKKGITNDRGKALLLNRYGVRESKALTSDEANDFLQFLQNYRPVQPIKKAT